MKTPKLTGNQEYRQMIADNLRFYFDQNSVISKANMDFIHKGWTFSFVDDRGSQGEIGTLYHRIKELIYCLIQTGDSD